MSYSQFAHDEAEARHAEYIAEKISEAQSALDTEFLTEVEGSFSIEVLSYDEATEKVEILTTTDTVYGPPLEEDFYGTVAEYIAQEEARRDAYTG